MMTFPSPMTVCRQAVSPRNRISGQPDVILLDEPSLGLAPKLFDEVYAIIRRLRAEGRTMLLVEQFANIALSVADAAYVMENGRIVLSGRAANLLNDPIVREAYVGASQSDHLAGAHMAPKP